MDQPVNAIKAEAGDRISDRAFAATALALAFMAYFVVFLLNQQELDIIGGAVSSVTNLVPLAIVAAAAKSIIERHLIGRSTPAGLAWHVVLAALFSVLWYWLLMVMLGLRSGDSVTEFVVRAFFPEDAITWQLLQGVTVYALVASLTCLRAQPLRSGVIAAEPSAAAGKDQSPSRYFIKKGEDLHPIDVSQIISITGADDYAEVATLSERHLVRMTLGDFEKTLEGENFIRVHRSRIVNVDRIARAEPAGGGRMLLHMEDGEIIQASRAGSKLMRDRVI